MTFMKNIILSIALVFLSSMLFAQQDSLKELKMSPPGTVWLHDNIYIDMVLVTNADYSDFLYTVADYYSPETQKEIQNIDMEEVKLQIEEARKQLEHVDFEEIRLEIEKNKEQMIKEIDMESIQKEILKAQEEIAKIDMEKIRIEMDESLNNIDKAKIINDMEKDLEKLEGLELEEK